MIDRVAPKPKRIAGFLGIGSGSQFTKEQRDALFANRELLYVMHDPCTFILQDSIRTGHLKESDADRRFRAARRREQREMAAELIYHR